MQLKPLDLATDPTRIAIGETTYDFIAQKRAGVTPLAATTFRATQTHGTSGKPIDNDND